MFLYFSGIFATDISVPNNLVVYNSYKLHVQTFLVSVEELLAPTAAQCDWLCNSDYRFLYFNGIFATDIFVSLRYHI